MTEMKRVSEHNLLLLAQQRQFLQDASHELGTPLTIALGHAELIQSAAMDQAIAKDARVAVAELLRIRRLTSRMLLLASTEGPDFLHLAPVDVDNLVVETLDRWRHMPRLWSVGSLAGIQLQADGDRLTLALDALIENAVHHTDAGGQIELSARGTATSSSWPSGTPGSGIPAAEVERIFGRFYRLDSGRNGEAGGFGLGLAIVKAIAEAHQGCVRCTAPWARARCSSCTCPIRWPGSGRGRRRTGGHRRQVSSHARLDQGRPRAVPAGHRTAGRRTTRPSRDAMAAPAPRSQQPSAADPAPWPCPRHGHWSAAAVPPAVPIGTGQPLRSDCMPNLGTRVRHVCPVAVRPCPGFPAAAGCQRRTAGETADVR